MRSTNAELYGRSVFTTVAIIKGEPFLWAKHWSRLRSQADTVGIDTSYISEDELRGNLSRAVADSRLSKGRARITLFDDSQAARWAHEESRPPFVEIIVAELSAANPIALGVSPFRLNSQSPLTGVKSGNYLEQILCIKESINRGYSEAVRLNETGHVSSGCMANIFWVTDTKLQTPSLSTGCLAGTTREYILENMDCDEVQAGLEILETASSIYLTSGGIGIARVDKFLGRKLETFASLENLRTSSGL